MAKATKKTIPETLDLEEELRRATCRAAALAAVLAGNHIEPMGRATQEHLFALLYDLTNEAEMKAASLMAVTRDLIAINRDLEARLASPKVVSRPKKAPATGSTSKGPIPQLEDVTVHQ